MPIRRLIVIALFVCLAASSAEARRRAVRLGTRVPAPVPGCHTFGLVRPGLKATYVTTTAQGNVNFAVTYISDQPTRTHTTQQVSAPTGNADVETILDGEIVGLLRALKHIYLKTVMTVPVLGKLTTEVDIDFVPSLAAGPANGWCVGEKWAIPPVLQTITTRSITGTTVISNNTIASEGEVLAVNDTLVTPAGTFQTVKYKSMIVSANGASPAVTWVSMEHNIVVRQEAPDSGGGLQVTQLTLLQ